MIRIIYTATPRPLPPLPALVVIAGLSALSWISLIGVGWAALILWRTLT